MGCSGDAEMTVLSKVLNMYIIFTFIVLILHSVCLCSAEFCVSSFIPASVPCHIMTQLGSVLSAKYESVTRDLTQQLLAL